MRNDEDIKKIWFTADLHFLHPKIVQICDRPTTIEEHDEWLLARINSKVNKHDTLYIIGDVSMASKEKTEKILHKVNGNKILILGNHDNNIDKSTLFGEIKQIKNFTFSSPSYPNIHIVLCHYPIASWERKVHGSWHLYGHTHNRFQNSGLSFDVGVDAQDYYPISLEEVMDKMTKLSLNLF
jgi:calcineurin-like phosphoesterase family protein